MDLKSHLEEWARTGLITGDQARAIMTFEQKRGGTPMPTARHDQSAEKAKDPAKQRNWAIYGIVGIGVTAIMTGIVSLVAANWEDIPKAAKLATYFIVQTALGYGFHRRAERPGIVREALLALFGLHFLAGIGLLGQVYNLHSDGWQGVRFWLILSLPAALLAQSRLLPWVWLKGVLAALGLWLAASASDEEPRRTMESITYVYLVASVGMWRHPALKIAEPFRKAASEVSMLVLVPFATLCSSFLWIEEVEIYNFWAKHGVWMHLPWIGLAVTLLSLGISYKQYSRKFVRSVGAMLLVATAYYTLPMLFETANRQIASAVIFVVIWGLAGFAAVAEGRRRVYDAITIVIALRFVVVYFEVFGSLAATGIGLIISGALILGVAYVWHRYRVALLRWMEAQ